MFPSSICLCISWFSPSPISPFSYYVYSHLMLPAFFDPIATNYDSWIALNKALYTLASCLSLPCVTTCYPVHVVMSCFWLIAASCSVSMISSNSMPRCPSAEFSASLSAFVKTQNRKEIGQGLTGRHAAGSPFPFALLILSWKREGPESLAQEEKNAFLWFFKQMESVLRENVHCHPALQYDPTVSLNTAFRCASLDGCMDSGLLACTIEAHTLFHLILLSSLNSHTHLTYIKLKVEQWIKI